MASSVDVLDCKEDKYDGIIVTPELLPRDPATFTAALAHSLQVWQHQGKHGIWLKVPIDRAALIALAVEAGQFSFHHAEEGYVMLTRWLSESPNTIPPNASHQVGVGAFVMNPERREVLMVQERKGPLRGMGFWKMPTGLVLAGEDISEAVEREVFEETGVNCRFQGILAIRQAHGFAFGKSDLFFLCALHTEPGCGQPPIVVQDTEIEAATWMPLDEFYQAELAKPPLYQKFLERCRAYVEGRCAGMPVARLEAGMWGKPRQDWLCWATDQCDVPPDEAASMVDVAVGTDNELEAGELRARLQPIAENASAMITESDAGKLSML